MTPRALPVIAVVAALVCTALVALSGLLAHEGSVADAGLVKNDAVTRHLMLLTTAGSHILNFMGHLMTDREELIRESALPTETCTMVRMFRPAGHCKEIQRFGGEGGKWVCGMSNKPEARRVIYSIGSNYQVRGRL